MENAKHLHEEKVSGYVRRQGRLKRDWALGACIIGAVTLLMILLLPLIGSLKTVHSYHGFIQDLADSSVYGKQHGTITATVDGVERSVPGKRADRLFTTVVDTGMGHPRKTVPETEGILIEYGDESSLRILPVDIRENGRISDTGVLFSYTRRDGNVFSYDTDKLEYEKVTEILVGD